MDRIVDALVSSRYSIHDLTRVYGDPGKNNLARFNMPFEFGMAFLHTLRTGGPGVAHDWLALLPDAHPRGEFLSDLGGFDPASYDGTPQGVLTPVLGWLFDRPTAPMMPANLNPEVLGQLLPTVEASIGLEITRWGGQLRWNGMVDVVRDAVLAAFAGRSSIRATGCEE
jgi:hypothetical protein